MNDLQGVIKTSHEEFKVFLIKLLKEIWFYIGKSPLGTSSVQSDNEINFICPLLGNLIMAPHKPNKGLIKGPIFWFMRGH